MMTREECLEMAKKQVTGGRVEDYGKPEDNFSFIADLWSAYLGEPVLTSKDVALMMILLKVARAAAGTKSDSWTDIAGYAACGAEMDIPALGSTLQEY